MAKLDRSRPFGEVFGFGKVRFEQDGKQFDVNEDELVSDAQAGEEPAPEVAKPKRGKAKG